MKGAVKKSKMERGKKKAKLKGIAKQWNTKEKEKQNAVSWQSKGLKEIQQEKNLPSKIVQRKKNDNKDTSKATERKANKQRRKETKAKRENHEAMQNAKQRYERKTKEQSKAPEKQ